MTQKFDCKFYLVVDENGEFAINEDAGTAFEEFNYKEDVGQFAQTYEITLKVPGAKPLVIEMEVPEIEGATSVELEVKAE